MLNFTTEQAGQPAAVLLRAILPHEGASTMRKRRIAWRQSRGVKGTAPWQKGSFTQFTDGPAKLCQALGIDGSWDGIDLCAPDSLLFIESRPAVNSVTTGPRVGLNSVPEPWKSIPWRFRVDQQQYDALLAEEDAL